MIWHLHDHSKQAWPPLPDSFPPTKLRRRICPLPPQLLPVGLVAVQSEPALLFQLGKSFSHTLHPSSLCSQHAHSCIIHSNESINGLGSFWCSQHQMRKLLANHSFRRSMAGVNRLRLQHLRHTAGFKTKLGISSYCTVKVKSSCFMFCFRFLSCVFKDLCCIRQDPMLPMIFSS